MPNIQSKINVPVAQNKTSRQNHDSIHITSADFMELSVSKAFECPKGKAFKFNQQTFSRLAPMPVPTFGRAEMRHKSFFVPFRTVWPAWNDFINQTPHVYNNGLSSIPVSVPLIRVNDFYRLINNAPNDFAVGVTPPSEGEFRYDICIKDPNFGTDKRYLNLTDKGRRMYKLLLSLGYKFTFKPNSTDVVSALPLLCFLRIYCDWFFSSQYANDPDYNRIAKYFNRNDEVDTGSSFISYADLLLIFRQIENVNYDSDYFTNVWDNPTGPNSGLNPSIVMPDITTPVNGESASSIASDTIYFNGTPILVPLADTVISQYSLNALRAVSDYCKRNQLAGSRAVDRYLARFGVNLSSEALNRSILVNSFEQQLQFGDVTCTADTDKGNLGDYAGKGLSYGEGGFDFYTDEYGYFINVCTIVPHTSYYQGYDRATKHLTAFDFLTPEFDALGVQAMSKGEVFTPIDAYENGEGENFPSDYHNQVFGFVPRYAEYKVPFDLISGDFVLRSRNRGRDSWHLFRDLLPEALRTGSEGFVHSPDFISGGDSSQYNRIFYNTGEYANADHFNIIHNFNIDVTMPCASLYDDYEFKDEDKSKKVTMNVGGTTLN